MLNTNSVSFWNNRLKEKKGILFNSPIFIHKNKVVINYLKKINKENILDIGVGNGYIEEKIKNKYKDANLSGIDISHYSIKALNKKYKTGFKIGNIKNIPFNDQKFNIVLTLDILEHLSSGELKIAMSEISRVLKKKGYLIISVPINENKTDSKSNRHLTNFNYEKLHELLRKHSFNIVNYKYLYAFPKYYYTKTIIVKLLKLTHIKPNLLIVKAVKL